MKKQTLFTTLTLIALVALVVSVPAILMGEMTSKEFGDTGDRFLAREAGAGEMLTSFTATMDIEILSIYLHIIADPTTGTIVAAGEFNAIVDSAIVNSSLSAYNYTYINFNMESLTTTGTTVVWPTGTDANHYYLEKEDHLNLTWDNPTSTTVWGLEVFYERM